MRRPSNGGCTFAEYADRPAPHARLLWRAGVDPGVVCARAAPTASDDPDGIDLAALAGALTIARGAGGHEYVALSDGWRRVRLDLVEGSLVGPERVKLVFELPGFADLPDRLSTLRRLFGLRVTGRFDPTLFPPPAGLPRRLETLRVADALHAGASYREIAAALFGAERVRREWRAPSDFLLSRVRRRVAEAKAMIAGGYRALLAEDGSSTPAHLTTRR